jgi:hypothetical protein
VTVDARGDAFVSIDGSVDLGDAFDTATTTTPTPTPTTRKKLESAGPCPVTKVDGRISANGVHVLVPGCAVPSAGFPAVVFAHGFQLTTTGYDQLLGHLASYGFLVASVDYPCSLLTCNHLHVGTAIVAGKTALIAGSISGVPKVDPTKIVASGHSLGGKGAFLAVLADATFAAALAFDPVDGNPGNPLSGGATDPQHPQLTPTSVARLTLPVGLFGAALSHCKGSRLALSACAPTNEDAFAFAAALVKDQHSLWTVADFGHMEFLDDPHCGLLCSACVAGTSPVEPHLLAVEAISVAYLQMTLLGDMTNVGYLNGEQLAAYVSAGTISTGATAPACK